jgi:hypothetical protein
MERILHLRGAIIDPGDVSAAPPRTYYLQIQFRYFPETIFTRAASKQPSAQVA